MCVQVSLKQSAGFLVMQLICDTANNEMRFKSHCYVQTKAKIKV